MNPAKWLQTKWIHQIFKLTHPIRLTRLVRTAQRPTQLFLENAAPLGGYNKKNKNSKRKADGEKYPDDLVEEERNDEFENYPQPVVVNAKAEDMSCSRLTEYKKEEKVLSGPRGGAEREAEAEVEEIYKEVSERAKPLSRRGVLRRGSLRSQHILIMII